EVNNLNDPLTGQARVSQRHAQSTGQQLKEIGIKEVSEHNDNWMERAILKIKYDLGNWKLLSYLDSDFTGEDIRHFITGTLGNPNHPNAFGALINTLIKRKIIVPTGEHRKMKDSRSHARSTP